MNARVAPRAGRDRPAPGSLGPLATGPATVLALADAPASGAGYRHRGPLCRTGYPPIIRALLPESVASPTLAYLAFAAVAILGPGVALQRLARVRIDPALVVPLGSAFVAGTYWLSIASGLTWLFPLAVGATLATLLLPGRPWALAEGPSLRGALPPFLAVVALLALTQYRWNRLSSEGEFLMDPLVAYDTAFHVGLTHELAVGYPPQVPGVSGFPLGYHLGIDLVRAAALRWARVHPYDSVSRFDVTLWALALILALRAAAHASPALRGAVGLAGWTVLLTDFSFVFAANPSAVWWCDILRGNVLLSLALSNPVVPGLGLTLAALVALGRHLGGAGPGAPTTAESRGWLVLAALAAAATPFFKVFLGAHLLLGLGTAFLLAPRAHRALVLAALPCALATAALALGQGGETVAVELRPLDLVHLTRESLNLSPVAGWSLLAFSTLWLTASLGLRVLGLPGVLRALRSRQAVPAALATMAVAGWPLGLLFRVAAPEVLPGQRPVNDAAYLLEQSGPLLWLFAAAALAPLLRGRRRLLGAGLLLLAVPSTVHFAARKAALPPDRLGAPMVRAVRSLEKATAPGDVVLQRPAARYPPAPVILLGRRVPYERFTPWLTQFASAPDLHRRHEAVYRFFRTTDPAEARAIATSLGARAVCLYGHDRLRFDATGWLRPLHVEAEASCSAVPASR